MGLKRKQGAAGHGQPWLNASTTPRPGFTRLCYCGHWNSRPWLRREPPGPQSSLKLRGDPEATGMCVPWCLPVSPSLRT